MKKIILSLAIVGVVGAVVIGGTIAYFSDTATISGNILTAGTLDLKIDEDTSGAGYRWVNSFTAPSGYFDNLFPGFSSGDGQIVDLKNVGTVDGYATIKFETANTNELVGVLKIEVLYDGDRDGNFNDGLLVLNGPLSVWNGNTYTLGPIVGGEGNASGYDATTP